MLYFNTHKPHSFFLQNPSCIRKPQVISRGGGGEAQPLHPPPRSASELDREGRKIIVENGGNHSKESKAILYMSRKLGGRGLKSLENEHKTGFKIKAAVKLYCNADPTMAAVRSYRMDVTPSLKMPRSTQRSWIYSYG